MSTEHVGQAFTPVRQAPSQHVAIPIQPDEGAPPAADKLAGECLEFVRFCYRRRRVSWPSLYDEMAAVAARGTFRGLGFAELAEHGICFSLPNLPRLAALTEQVMLEERHTARSDEPAGRLTLIPARG